MFKKNRTVLSLLIAGIISFVLLIGYSVYSLKHRKDADLLTSPAVDKKKAIEIADSFIKGLGFDTGNYPNKALAYRSRNKEMLYLLETFDEKKVSELVNKKGLPYTYWVVDYTSFGENILVCINDRNGQIIDYTFLHPPSKEEKITNLNQRETMDLVESFLGGQGQYLSHLELVSQARNNDTLEKAAFYRWKKQDKELEGVTCLINLDIRGNRVSSYSQNLELPDSFTYKFKKGIYLAGIWSSLSMFLYFVVGCVLVGYALVKRRSINWRGARMGGLLCGAIFLVSSLNDQISSFSLPDVLFKLIYAAISAFAMFVLLACTEHAFKKSFKRSIFMKKNRETVISAVIVSYSLTFIFMLLNYAGSALFEHFGLMQEVGAGFVESSILTSNVIYLTPFLIGLLPAITEEFMRGFTMAMGRKILKKTFFAIVLSAFIWGFAHTATDGSVMPGYAHGVMFFIDGIVIGYLLLYFGIEVTIIWHFLNNFIATNLFLLFLKKSLTVYGIFSLVVIVSTFVIAAVLWFRQKKEARFG